MRSATARHGNDIREVHTMLATTVTSNHGYRPIMAERSGPPTAGDTLASWLVLAVARRLEPREHLFCEGDPATHVYRVESGHVCIYKMMRDGRRQVVDFAYPGDFVALGCGKEHSTSAYALGACRVKCIPAPALRQLSRQDPDLAAMIGELLAEEVRVARELLLTCCQRSAAERLAAFLAMLVGRNVRKGGDVATLSLPMTRSDIGDFLGLTIETVSRTFSKFKAMGLIELSQCTTVRIKDLQALERFADGEGMM